MKAVVFGPGRIGCGFAGQLLHASGWEVVLVGRGPVVDHLSRVGRYRVRLTGGRGARELEVPVARALDVADAEAIAAEIGGVDLVAVSVGPRNLPAVAPLLAAGLARRTSPVNILAFENCADAAGCLRDAVERCAPAVRQGGHGWSGALVSRIVARRIGDPDGDAPLAFVGDAPNDFAVHGPSLRAPMPRIEGLRAVDDFAAQMTKKLYTFSAGHAAAAYLGALKGYRYIHSAIRDPEIRAAVLAAMQEGQRGLAMRYGPELAGVGSELDEIVSRFENAALDDPVSRVGRDPLRKLGPEDRLVGAARLAAEAGVWPRRLALAAAAAICFACAEGQSGNAPWRAATLRAVSGLDAGSGFGREVWDALGRLAAGREPDAVLLHLDRLVWSWGRQRRPGVAAEPDPEPLRSVA